MQKLLIPNETSQLFQKCNVFKKFTEAYKGIRKGNTWQKKFNPKAPKAGDLAPDFELWDVKGENPIRLSQFFDEKPVALIFGSFT